MGLVATALGGVFSTLFGLAANILGTITGAILGVAVALFNWVASPNFISLSYTDPARNPFLQLGWELTRDLTNIFFVVALVVIGLGTALRFKDYQVQKALPILIIIALLVNFTPVICGLIVDASNIAMNFFIQGGFAGGNSFLNFAFSQWSNTMSLVGGLKFWDPTASQEAIAAATGSMVLIFFNLIAAFIYLLFAALFIIRYVAIWLLVILSPFAFACRIFPATKNVWDMWWKNFIQWSLLGVIAAFFLYLGDHFIRTAISGGFLTGSMDQVTSAPGLSGIINNVLPYFISIILLFIGLFLSLSFTPKGADSIMKFGQKAGKWAGKATRKLAVEGLRGVPVVQRAEARARRRLEMSPVIGRALGGPGAYTAGLDKDRKRVGKNLETMTPAEIRQVMDMRVITREDRMRRARGLEILAEKNQIGAADQPHVAEALQFGVSQGTIYDKMPHWDPNIRRRVEGMDVEEFRKNVRSEALENVNVFQAMDLRKVVDLGEKGKRAQKEALRTNVINNLAVFNARIAALRATGNPDDAREAKKIEDMGKHIVSSPNYVT